MRNQLLRVCVLAAISTFGVAQTIPGSNPPATEASSTPRVIRYEGTIAAPQGVNNLTFALYATKTGGTAVWSEAQNVAVDAAGKFSALLGASTPLPASVFVDE